MKGQIMSRSVFGIDFGTSTIKIYNGLTKTVITEKDIIEKITE